MSNEITTRIADFTELKGFLESLRKTLGPVLALDRIIIKLEHGRYTVTCVELKGV